GQSQLKGGEEIGTQKVGVPHPCVLCDAREFSIVRIFRRMLPDGNLSAPIVRNDEVVGSIPTSSTKFSITYSRPVTQVCPIVSQKISGGCRNLPQQTPTHDRAWSPTSSGR